MSNSYTRRDLIAGLGTFVAGSGARLLTTTQVYAEGFESKRPPRAGQRTLANGYMENLW